MRARLVRLAEERLDGVFGGILATDLRDGTGRPVLRKGTRLGERHRSDLVARAGSVVHLVELDAGEVEQDEVARRLARAIAGAGAAADAPVQGQVRVRATCRGLLRVDSGAVARINARPPLLCFTRPSGQILLAGDEVAGTKSASLATPERTLRDAEREAAATPVVSVSTFQRRRIAVVMTDRLQPRGRALMADAIRRKIAWFGSAVVGLAEIEHEAVAIEQELRASLGRGAELVLLSGANSLDPLDAVFDGVRAAGGTIERTGVPAHPGSMVWIGTIGPATVLGIATCAGFGKDTALDLLLARVLAGERAVTAADELGAAGLVEGPTARAWFPPYERDAVEAAGPVAPAGEREQEARAS